ncbi:MAG: S1 RNA-binding domain-containing protein, partial [Chloroflexia bacterium]|nr:S1 RNA-binding domain-containing protein [Chloroflexia bacterium]
SWVATKYDVNQLVVGRVTQLANFGAFARIEDGIEGLVHVSELSEARISHPRQYVSEGQDLLLRIIRIDPQRRRMGLSLRRGIDATDEEVQEALGEEAVALKHRLMEMEIEPDPDAPEQDSYSAESRDEAPQADTSGEVVTEIPPAAEAPEEQLSGTMADQLASLSEELGAEESEQVAEEEPLVEVEETVVEAEPTIDAAVEEAETRLEIEAATIEDTTTEIEAPANDDAEIDTSSEDEIPAAAEGSSEQDVDTSANEAGEDDDDKEKAG